MKIKQLLLAAALTIVITAASYELLPSQWCRNSGVLDLVLVLDWGASNHDNLPTAVNGTRRLLNAVLPGDRVAIYAVGPAVNELVCGPVNSATALSILDRQVATLRSASDGGTLLGEGFTRVRGAFDGFVRNYSGKHRRVLVVFSDCSNGSLEGGGTSNPAVAGQASVLVIGFRGQNKDAVTQALLGTDASNDVLIVPPGEAVNAINNLLDTIRQQCHPLRISRLVLLFAFCAVAGGILSLFILTLSTRNKVDLSIRLTADNDEDSAQVFPLSDGATISIGGDDHLHDFTVPVNASCSVTRSADSMSLLPGNGTLQLQRQGVSIDVIEPCPLKFGDTFRLEGTSVTLRKS